MNLSDVPQNYEWAIEYIIGILAKMKVKKKTGKLTIDVNLNEGGIRNVKSSETISTKLPPVKKG